MSDKTLYSTHYDNDKCRTYGSSQIIHTTHALFYHVRPNSRCRHFDEIVVTAWLHWKLSKCQASVQPIMKVSSKMTDFRFCFWLISSNNPNWAGVTSYWMLNSGITWVSCVSFVSILGKKTVIYRECVAFWKSLWICWSCVLHSFVH